MFSKSPQFFDKKLTISFSIKYAYIIGFVVAVTFVAYAAWECYWYKQVGIGFVKWHTHFMAIVYLWLLLVLFAWFVVKPLWLKYCKNLLLAISSVCFTLLFTETFFTLSGLVKTTYEKTFNIYASAYQPGNKGIYHVYNGNSKHNLTSGEFNYSRATNSLGYADYEWSVARKPNTIRILTLGDSFTEGDGAPYDSSYVALLRQKFKACGVAVEIFNGGICGSDHYFNFVDYRDRLSVYKPDIIIQTLSSQDIYSDIIIYGGMERFVDSVTLKYKPAPWWEPLWAISYTSRAVFIALGYDETLIDNNMRWDADIDKGLMKLFTQYKSLAEANNCKLLVIQNPLYIETEHAEYRYKFGKVRKAFNEQGIQVVDLLPCYKQHIATAKANTQDYYWEINSHHNAKGYDMMASCIMDAVMPLVNAHSTTGK